MFAGLMCLDTTSASSPALAVCGQSCKNFSFQGAEPSPLDAWLGLLLNSLREEPLEGLARLLALAVLGGADAAGPAR